MNEKERVNWWEREDYHDLTFAQKNTLICEGKISLDFLEHNFHSQMALSFSGLVLMVSFAKIAITSENM